MNKPNVSNGAPKISILVIGREVLDGRIAESNARYLAEQLRIQYGTALHSVLWCDDEVAEIVESLAFLAQESEIIITSGGLGPTSDDKTRQAVADFLGVPLEYREAVALEIQEFLKARGRPYVELNSRQAYFPAGAEKITNKNGTAPAFLCQHLAKGRNCATQIWSLPGVPREFLPLIDNAVLPRIAQQYKLTRSLLPVCATVYGLAESKIAEIIEHIDLPTGSEVSYRPSYPEVFIRVCLKPEFKERLSTLKQEIIQRLGDDHVISSCSGRDSQGESLISVVHRLLLEKKATVSVGESCTGGQLSAALTRLPGSSAYFLGGVTAYSNSAKNILLGVPTTMIEQHGAVSPEVAEALVSGCRQRFGSDFAISVTGIAGPDGGSVEKPVGTVFVGLSSAQGISSWCLNLHGTRDQIQKGAYYGAIYRLWQALKGEGQ